MTTIGPSQGRAETCCEGLRGYQLAWHRYAAHDGSYPRKPRRFRRQMARVDGLAKQMERMARIGQRIYGR